MNKAKEGDKVRVHYTGKLDDGTVFDSSADREPLEFTIGEEQVIPGFEQAVIGMEPGETKTAAVSPDRAYGPYREEMIVEVDRSQFPDDLEPEVDQRLQMRRADGHSIVVRVADVSAESVLLDANHPLAGKDLIFDIELVEIG
ncbi:MAG: peptidylprolyl isomerase [Candidatus Abyssobacteria bacterium SURF_5]|uniref:Peptidyl-prolyl cis-trans isomerase n=1 Tax=Abyssobacteria bacterium (strain SURF_5) TaxID=2093360 RepID=A0A3A4NU21_ABYX5|nr:MAG: peptidylprolyl isomerase [Candidatus Abyssubacteria bacterium SURF_5]